MTLTRKWQADVSNAVCCVSSHAGVLTAHMMEHRRAITRVAASPAGFAITTSADETAKVGCLGDVCMHAHNIIYSPYCYMQTTCKQSR